MWSLSFTGLVKKSVGSQPVTATASIYYFCFPPLLLRFRFASIAER